MPRSQLSAGERALIRNIKQGIKEDRRRYAEIATDRGLRSLGETTQTTLLSIAEIAGRPHKESPDLLQRRLDEIARISKDALKKIR